MDSAKAVIPEHGSVPQMMSELVNASSAGHLRCVPRNPMVDAVVPGERMPPQRVPISVVHGCPSAFDCNLDGVDPVRVERQVLTDLRYGGVRRFVSPDGVGRALSTGRAAVVSTLAFVGAVSLV